MDPFIFHLNEAAAKGLFFTCVTKRGYFTPDEVRAEYGKQGFNPMDWRTVNLHSQIEFTKKSIARDEANIARMKAEILEYETVIARV